MVAADTPVARAIVEQIAVKKLPDEARHRCVVLHSGGLDSFCVLYSLLAATRLSVHAHHVELRNREGRADAELSAIAKQRDWLSRNVRPFEYSDSRHDFPGPSSAGTDTQVTLFMGGRLVIQQGGGFWSLWTGHIRPPEWEMTEGAAVLHAMFINRAIRPYWLRPLKLLEKRDILASLPEEARPMAWTCRTPLSDGEDGFAPCGSCPACLQRADAEAALQAQGTR